MPRCPTPANRAPQTTAALARLLDEMTDHPERRSSIEARIDAAFGQTRAVLVLDMSGFARHTQRHGIVSFLLMIHRMKRIALPAIEARGGIVAKAEADNLYCLLDRVEDAVAAAREIIARLDAANAREPEHRLETAIGIGYGRVLNVEDQDVLGDEMNLACKLGEDIAGPGMVLLTAAAMAAMDDGSIEARREEISISGIALTYHQLA